MTDKKPFVKVSAGFYLKNAPKGYLGIRNEQWNFGIKLTPLDNLIYGIVLHLCEFYANAIPDNVTEVNAAIRKAGEAIKDLQFEDTEMEG